MFGTEPRDPQWSSYLVRPRSDGARAARIGLRLNRKGESKAGDSRERPLTDGLVLSGMENISAAAGEGALPGNGCFYGLKHMDVTAVFIPSVARADEIKATLTGEYEFVPNGPMYLSGSAYRCSSVSPDGSTASSNFQWPGVSGVPMAHRGGTYGAEVLLGVLDTGIDADHEEFVYQTIPFCQVKGYPWSGHGPYRRVRGFDPDGHGTGACGLMAGRNIGIAPECRLFVASVAAGRGACTDLISVMLALVWLLGEFCGVENADRPAVVCLGPAVRSTPGEKDPDGTLPRTSFLEDVASALSGPDMDILMVGPVQFGGVGDPGTRPGGEVIRVAQVDTPHREVIHEAVRPSLVGYGTNLNSSAGRDYTGRSLYGRVAGPGMAVAYVAGIAALLRSRYPGLSAGEIRGKLLEAAIPVDIGPGGKCGLARFLD